MKNKLLVSLVLVVFIINVVSGLPVCSDINQQDISKMPCSGFTISLNCSSNVTAFNATNASINFTFTTEVFVDNVYNFTLDLPTGNYELLDCENNTATFQIKRLEQGFGINLFGIMFPSILLTLISLFISGRMFSKFNEDDDEKHERMEMEHEEESFVPKNRLLPIVFMLFSFIPMVFMVGFVNIYLEEFMPSLGVTEFYGLFFILFSSVFYFTILISFVVWLGTFIKMRRVMRGLDDID